MIQVGQILYRPPGRGIKEITEYKVTKVGRKNFEVEGHRSRRGKFVIETLMYEDQDYSQDNFQLYTSLQAIEDEKKLHTLTDKVSAYFRRYGRPSLTLEQAEGIIKILGL